MKQDHARIKLQKMLGMETSLPLWMNAIFSSSEGVEIWIDPSATTHPEIPSHIDNVPIKIRRKGPGTTYRTPENDAPPGRSI